MPARFYLCPVPGLLLALFFRPGGRPAALVHVVDRPHRKLPALLKDEATIVGRLRCGFARGAAVHRVELPDVLVLLVRRDRIADLAVERTAEAVSYTHL